MTDSKLLATYPPFTTKFVKGEGVYLYDDNNKEYLDCLSGIAVVSLGHTNEEISKVICAQANKLSHVSNYFENEYTQLVAQKINEKITSTNKDTNGKVFFSNSGAEANECAIKIAKRYGEGKRYKFLTATNSFHGRTLATLAATGQPAKHKNFLPLPEYFKHFEFGNVQSIKDQIDDETVGVIIEIIQGEGGVKTADQEFFYELQKICTENDLLLIIDEIQTGMCRTGKWFGFQNYGLNPDIVTMAKALGNGFPVGACWSKDEIAKYMQVGDHGSTFGGQPLALSVVKSVFDILEREDMATRAEKLGEIFINELINTNLFSQVRGLGLLIGADINTDIIKIDALQLVKNCLANGLIINATSDNTIRIAPPLIINEDQIMKAISIIKKSADNE